MPTDYQDRSENRAIGNLELLAQARSGDSAALGELLQRFRSYLRLLADARLHQKLRGKADASDVVQDAFVDVQRQFHNFRGQSIPEFTVWLRAILVGQLAQHFRKYLGTQQRSIELEQSLDMEVDRSSCCLQRELVAGAESPSHVLVFQETLLQVSEAIDNLPMDYRTVLLLRHMEGLTFPQIAQDMERTVDSVEKLWIRALGKLRAAIKDQHAYPE